MKRSWWYRFTFLLVVSVMAIVTIIPTALDFKEESNYPVKSKINLGLDLQGGLYMILGIDFNKVYLDEIKGYARRIEFVLKDEGIDAKIGVVDTSDITDPKHSIILSNAADHDKAVSRVKQFFGSYLRLTSDEGDTTLQYGMAKVAKTQIEEQSVSKSIEVIRNRIDEFGVTEPEIISQGNDRIIVQLPGVKDIERAKELIGRTAKLSFKMVNDEVSPATIQGWLDKAKNNGINYKKGTRFSLYIQQLNEYLRKDFPAGYELAFEKRVSKFNNEIETQIPYLIEANPKLTG
ncbi:MAG: hypothetical protein KC493_14285, partial [Bacteriovoracaceae bacterium]|nr:hypothetical protein [Bacteriovoracaceae bacterium]